MPLTGTSLHLPNYLKYNFGPSQTYVLSSVDIQQVDFSIPFIGLFVYSHSQGWLLWWGLLGMLKTRPETNEQMIKLIRAKISPKGQGQWWFWKSRLSRVGIDQMISGQERRRGGQEPHGHLFLLLHDLGLTLPLGGFSGHPYQLFSSFNQLVNRPTLLSTLSLVNTYGRRRIWSVIAA